VDGMDDQVQVGRLASVPGVGALTAIFEKNVAALYWTAPRRCQRIIRPEQVSPVKDGL
jgi:hypothetical protein